MSGPILFFDSGVGGLSILRAVREKLPHAPMVYCADSAGFPYGTRSEAEIATRVPALLGRLFERVHPSLIVIACNTASTIALSHVRAALDIGIVGTVPAIKPAAEQSQTRVIGVLGTEATVRQPYVDNLSRQHAQDCLVLRHGSAPLVEMAERKLKGLPLDDAVFHAAIDGLISQQDGDRMDTLVLACTHFPLVADELQRAAPRPLRMVDGADGIARRVVYLTQELNWPETPVAGKAIFTGDAEDLDALRPALSNFGLVELESL